MDSVVPSNWVADLAFPMPPSPTEEPEEEEPQEEPAEEEPQEEPAENAAEVQDLETAEDAASGKSVPLPGSEEIIEEESTTATDTGESGASSTTCATSVLSLKRKATEMSLASEAPAAPVPSDSSSG